MAGSESGFKLVYAPTVHEHMKAIQLKYYSLIRGAIEKQLQFQPDVETRNIKPLKRTTAPEGDWEIRFGPKNRFRVFYKVDHQRNEVHILAIGVKEGNRLLIGGKEVES